MKTVVLGLGSNRAFNSLSPIDILASAVKELKEMFTNLHFSAVYISRAMYYEEQEDFYNLVVIGQVAKNITPSVLLDCIHIIERKYGRNRMQEVRYGPRTLDIDIEEYGDIQITSPSLTIPHPKMKERAFVLLPYLELLLKGRDKDRTSGVLTALNKLVNQEVKKAEEAIQEAFIKKVKG